MTTTIAYACLTSIIFMFSLLCLFVYTYGVKFTKDVRRSRSSSVFTISPYFGSNPTCPPLPVYNIRTDLPPSYEQVVIGINVTPASISAAPERVPVQ